MSATKESDLMQQILLYVSRCSAENDRHALRAMNLGREELQALSDLSLRDLGRTLNLRGHCLDIRFNRDVFWAMLRRYREARESELLQRSLIRADAPLPLMRTYFGTSSNDYTSLRQDAGLHSPGGRPTMLPEELSHEVWRLWNEADKIDGEVRAHIFLEIHERTGASMRAIWALVRRWRLKTNCCKQDPAGRLMRS